MKSLAFILALTPLLFTGCAVHSPMLGFNRTVLSHEVPEHYSPHTNLVFITKKSLPPSVKCDNLCQIDVGKVWWGNTEWVLRDMANRAREVGADALIEVNTWHQPAGWSWAAPHGVGKAVKIPEKAAIDFSTIEGVWR